MRSAQIQAVQQAGTAALPRIDAILQQYGGKRLADSVNALGCLPVETTSEGVHALASSDLVKAVLENQSVSRLR